MFLSLTQPDIWLAINAHAFPNMRATTFHNYTDTASALFFRYHSMLKASTHLKYVSLRRVVASDDFAIIDAAIQQRHDDKLNIYTDEEYQIITFYDKNLKSFNDYFIVDMTILKQVSINTFCYLLENYCDLSTLTKKTKQHIILYVFRANDASYVERITGFKQMVLEQPNHRELFEKLMWDLFTDYHMTLIKVSLLRIRNQKNFLPILKWYHSNFGEGVRKYLRIFVRYGIDYGYIDVLEWLESIANLSDIHLDDVLSLGRVTDAGIHEFLKKYNYFTKNNIDNLQLPIDIPVSKGDIDAIKRIQKDWTLDKCHYTYESLCLALEEDHHEVIKFLAIEDTKRFNDFLRYYTEINAGVTYITRVVKKLIHNRITKKPYLSLSIEEQNSLIDDFMRSRSKEEVWVGLEKLLLESVRDANIHVVQYILSHSREISVEFVNKRFFVTFLFQIINYVSLKYHKLSYNSLIICKQIYHHTEWDVGNMRRDDMILIVNPRDRSEDKQIFFDLFDKICRKYVGTPLRIVERK